MNMIAKVLRYYGDELISLFLQSKVNLAKSTFRNYMYLLRKYLKFCESRDIHLLSSNEDDIYEFLSNYNYRSTKRSYKTILSIFFKWCIKHQLTIRNPTETITINNGKRKRYKLMSLQDYKLMKVSSRDLKELTIINLLWYTGIRAKELRLMQLSDIDLRGGLIFIRNSKTTSGYRTIPIHPNFVPLLTKYINWRKQSASPQLWLFLTKRHSNYHERTIIQLITKLQSKTNHKFSCHDFRRAFITRLYRKTSDLLLCQRFAGHSNIKTTRRYIIDDLNEQKRKFNALDF